MAPVGLFHHWARLKENDEQKQFCTTSDKKEKMSSSENKPPDGLQVPMFWKQWMRVLCYVQTLPQLSGCWKKQQERQKPQGRAVGASPSYLRVPSVKFSPEQTGFVSVLLVSGCWQHLSENTHPQPFFPCLVCFAPHRKSNFPKSVCPLVLLVLEKMFNSKILLSSLMFIFYVKKSGTFFTCCFKH